MHDWEFINQFLEYYSIENNSNKLSETEKEFLDQIYQKFEEVSDKPQDILQKKEL